MVIIIGLYLITRLLTNDYTLDFKDHFSVAMYSILVGAFIAEIYLRVNKKKSPKELVGVIDRKFTATYHNRYQTGTWFLVIQSDFDNIKYTYTIDMQSYGMLKVGNRVKIHCAIGNLISTYRILSREEAC